MFLPFTRVPFREPDVNRKLQRCFRSPILVPGVPRGEEDEGAQKGLHQVQRELLTLSTLPPITWNLAGESWFGPLPPITWN